MSLLTVCFCLFVCRRKVVKCWVFKPRPLKLLQVLVWILQRIELSTVWTLTEKNIFDAFFSPFKSVKGVKLCGGVAPGHMISAIGHWSFFFVFQPYPQRDIISVTLKKITLQRQSKRSIIFIYLLDSLDEWEVCCSCDSRLCLLSQSASPPQENGRWRPRPEEGSENITQLSNTNIKVIWLNLEIRIWRHLNEQSINGCRTDFFFFFYQTEAQVQVDHVIINRCAVVHHCPHQVVSDHDPANTHQRTMTKWRVRGQRLCSSSLVTSFWRFGENVH